MNEPTQGFYDDTNPEEVTYLPTKSIKSKPWQFSLKTLLAVITALSVCLALALVPPIAAMVVAVFYVGVLVACVMAIIYGRGWIRPFAISALVPLVVGILFVLRGVRGPGLEAFFVFSLFTFAFALAAGLSGAIVQGYLTRRSGLVPIPNLPFIRNWLSNEIKTNPSETQ